jgi:plastocyanin
MRRLGVLAVTLLVSGVAMPASLRGPSVVEMTSTMTFMPRELTVVVGEIVIWRNAAEMPHTVNTDVENCKSDEAKEWVKVPPGATPFFSGELKPGDEFRTRFEIPGTYRYLCIYHESQMMRGTIVVEGAEAK